jgi:hypothetical protein
MKTIKKNKGLRVLTANGYKEFTGIRKTEKKCLNIICDTTSLSATYDHRLMTSEGKFKECKDLNPGDLLQTKDGFTAIKHIEDIGVQVVYDLIDVRGTQSFFTNGINSHNCEFISSGESSVNDELFEKLNSKAIEPKFIFDEGKYLLWDEPKEDRIYIASVDTAEGLGKDASVVQILDYTDLTNINQVAVYHNNEISPYNFTEKVYEILQHWGNPLVCIERNNSGGQVVDILKNTHDYENIVSWGGSLANRKKQQLGIISHTNTKYKAVTNMRYWVNELESVQINDKRNVKELKNYVKAPNGTWNAKKGYHDDLVTSLMWNLIILDNDIVETYFEVIKRDTNNKPLELQQMDYGIKYFMNPTSVYTNEKNNMSNTLPVIIGNANNSVSEIDELQMQGYKVWQP